MDSQILLEVLRSAGGVLGTINTKNEQAVPIVFSNPDVQWATSYNLPRLGMGAFRLCIENLYKDATGHELQDLVQLGKPQPSTYEYATRILQEWRRDMGGGKDAPENLTMYMIGDSPDSDIRGAHVALWKSVLVKTGVWREEGNSPQYPADHVADNVLGAIKWILQTETSNVS